MFEARAIDGFQAWPSIGGTAALPFGGHAKKTFRVAEALSMAGFCGKV